jgi:flagellar basal-body rod modification protein FlgD
MSPVNSTTPLSSGTDISTQPAPTTTTDPNASLASEDTFLKLLVAQIQNQDPTDPTDPVQFVGQLTQYSELEQLMQINSGIQGLDGASSSASTGSGSATPDPATTPMAPTQPRTHYS